MTTKQRVKLIIETATCFALAILMFILGIVIQGFGVYKLYTNPDDLDLSGSFLLMIICWVSAGLVLNHALDNIDTLRNRKQ